MSSGGGCQTICSCFLGVCHGEESAQGDKEKAHFCTASSYNAPPFPSVTHAYAHTHVHVNWHMCVC